MRVDVKYIGDPKYIKTTYIHKERDRITVNVEMFLILNYSSIANTAIQGLAQELFFVKANYRTLYFIYGGDIECLLRAIFEQLLSGSCVKIRGIANKFFSL